MNILVLDVGTSSMRGILFNQSGHQIFHHQTLYHVDYQSDIIAEQNPEDWKLALYEISRSVSHFCVQNGLSIDGISITSQRSTIIPVDSGGAPVRNAIMWQDKRNAAICSALKDSEAELFHKTGSPLNTVFSGSKITWIKQNEPEIYKKTCKFLTVADYLVFLMTGEFKTDHTYGARSLLMNIHSFQWDDSLLKLFDVDSEKLCPLCAPGSILGYTTSGFEKQTSILSGIPVISAGGDQQCAALGHGVFFPGSMEITVGTGAFILAFCDKIPDTLSCDVICSAHSIPGKYVLESSMLTCASLYNWMQNNFYDTCSPNVLETMNSNVLSSPAGSNGCICLPYFQGRGTPQWTPHATGGFFNITLNTTRADMTRSVLEAIAFETCSNIEVLEKYLGEINNISIGGGLTHFSEFNQIQSDVYQKTLTHYHNSEQTAWGAWTLAAVTLGLYDNYENALNQLKQGEAFEIYEPCQTDLEIYNQQRFKLKKLFDTIF